ncbi:MAG: aldehyde dehydrogenase family protein, partial [Verrucomicrobiales bacterium]
KFPRTESGRYLVATNPKGGHVANYPKASRKDLRDAVSAAIKAQPGWAAAAPYLRGQILYRAAEMLEGRAEALAAEIAGCGAGTLAQARREVAACADRLVHYAGWADKLGQFFGSVNPVATPHFNFSVPEPTGVACIVCPDAPALLPLVTLLGRALATGNAAVVLASERFPLPALTLGEVLATSDLPGGVANLLSGQRAELAAHFASHMGVNAVVDASGDAAIAKTLQGGSAVNLKRVADAALEPEDWFSEKAEDAYRLQDTLEIKTAWHPIGV